MPKGGSPKNLAQAMKNNLSTFGSGVAGRVQSGYRSSPREMAEDAKANEAVRLMRHREVNAMQARRETRERERASASVKRPDIREAAEKGKGGGDGRKRDPTTGRYI